MPRTLLSGSGLVKPSIDRPLPSLAPADPGTPGNMVQSRLALSKRQLQDKVNYQRSQIIKQGKIQKLDNKQINTYIRKLYANADQKMMELTQRAETQVASLAELNQFGRVGGVSQDVLSRAKWRMLGGPEAGWMLKKPELEAIKDPVKEYGALDIHRNRLEKRAEGYRWSGTPGKAKLEVWDSWEGKWTTEKTVEQLEDAIALKNEIARVHQMQQTILRGPDFAMRGTALKSRRMVGGPLGDQIVDYIERKQGPQEQAFQEWYSDWARKTGLDPNPDAPEHKYDYRAAYKAGVEPELSLEDNRYHWPSQFKSPGHPRRFIGGVDTITGRPREPEDLTKMGIEELQRIAEGR